MASAANILQRQFKGRNSLSTCFTLSSIEKVCVDLLYIELTRSPVPGFVVDLKDDNIFEW